MNTSTAPSLPTEPRRDEPLVLASGEGEHRWFLNNEMTVKATASQTGGAHGLIESLIPPGFSPPLHIHHREEESYILLDGQLTVRCGDRTFTATAGAFVCLPREVPHTFVVEGDRPARMLTLITPGGGEGFFIDLSRAATHAGLPGPAPVDVDALRRVSAAYGSEVVGPPLGSS
jgi:mannose-6-phosphate isomerase-like protein (cupin superfamily)